MSQDILDQLTAPGAPFEFREAQVNGVSCRVFRDTLPCLSAIYDNLDTHADATLAVYEQRRLSYAQVKQLAARLASHLASELQVQAGQHVAIAMRNSPEWLISFIAITSLGAVAVLVNSRAQADELEFCIRSTHCELTLADSRCASALRTNCPDLPCLESSIPRDQTPGTGSLDAIINDNAVEPAQLAQTECKPNEPALILFTSGTTGRPKGAVLTHLGVMTALKTNQFSAAVIGAQMAAQYGVDLATLAANRPQTCTLLMFPLFHVSGCHSVLLTGLTQGAKIVFMHRWDAGDALRLVESEKITSFPGVPSMYWDLLRAPERSGLDLSSMTSLSVAGQATPSKLLAAIHAAFPNSIIGTGYGMTETNGAIAMVIGEEFVNDPTTAGRAVATTEIRLLDENDNWIENDGVGEICVSGATIMNGYYENDEANKRAFKDGWLRTGDIGRIGADGRLFIVDRKTDMVISGGENIYCAEVERALLLHERVAEASSFGVPDERLGERLIAVVKLHDRSRLEPQAILDFVGEHLAAYRVPKELLISDDDLPKNTSGKILKTQLRETYLRARKR